MVGCNDDSCGGTLQSLTDVAMTAGQQVHVRVAGWNGSQGAFQVQVTLPPPPIDCVVCPPSSVLENEPDCGVPFDSVNGGCNSSPPVFTAIALGQTACGTGVFNGATRDTDWYEFTIGAPTQVSWDVVGEFDLVIGLINSPCPQGAFIPGSVAVSGEPCIPLTSSLCLAAGTYYAFVAPNFTEVFACGTGAGNRYTATLSGVTCSPPTPPGNDLCPGFVVTAPSSTPGTTIAATNSAATCLGSAPDVFYSFNPPVSGSYILDTCGSAYDTSLAVYTDCTFATTVGCNDDFCGLSSSLTLSLTSGTAYVIRVGGFAGQSGTFTLNISAPPAAPTGACCVGASCSAMTAAACASAGGTYQGNGAPCTGAGTLHTYTSNPNIFIPDSSCPGGVTDTIAVADSYTISAIGVRVEIPAHTWIADLEISISNGVNTVIIWDAQCGGNNGLTVTFRDGAGVVVCAQPTTGTYNPLNPLAPFIGQNVSGASAKTCRLSAERLITQFEMITSTEASGSGMCSISPLRNSTFVNPDLRWFSRARANISSVMSRP